MSHNEERVGELAKLMQSDGEARALQVHLTHVLQGPAFTTSRRSAHFLQYVMEKAIARDIDSLKERAIGMAVFHRAPDYDTGEDAVVRVTASDVRKRLAQYYSTEGQVAEFRISLPPGGYAPEVSRSESGLVDPAPPSLPAQPRSEQEPVATKAPASNTSWSAFRRPAILWSLLGMIVVLGGWAYFRSSLLVATPSLATSWPLMFTAGKPLFVVLSDPDLNEIQLLTGKPVSLSDYANGHLGCESLPSDAAAICKTALSGDKVAAVDAGAIAKTAALAATFHGSIEPHAAREIRLTDIQSDRNILFIGSSRANPWTALFRDRLDFDVVHDGASKMQIVQNARPRAGESKIYLPTAGPHGTGENYALISFLHNLNSTGYVMMIAGATHEGTDVAVSIATDPARLSKLMAGCGGNVTEPYQILIKLSMMAGSPLVAHMVACHELRN